MPRRLDGNVFIETAVAPPGVKDVCVFSMPWTAARHAPVGCWVSYYKRRPHSALEAGRRMSLSMQIKQEKLAA